MLAVAPDGTAWAAADTQELVRMAPGRNAGGGAAQLPVEVTTIACPIAVGILAVARDGTAYGGSSGYATESLGPCAFRRQRVHQATAGIYRRRPDAPPVPER